MASHVSGPALTALGGKGPQSWFGSVTDLLLELSQGFSPEPDSGSHSSPRLRVLWETRVKTWTLQVEKRIGLCLLQGLALRGSRSRLEPREQVQALPLAGQGGGFELMGHTARLLVFPKADLGGD